MPVALLSKKKNNRITSQKRVVYSLDILQVGCANETSPCLTDRKTSLRVLSVSVI